MPIIHIHLIRDAAFSGELKKRQGIKDIEGHGAENDWFLAGRIRKYQQRDPKSGLNLRLHGPFRQRPWAVEYARGMGLGPRAVKSRPAGYVVEEE